MNDGDRTRDHRNHNPGLYQLSYVHHRIFTSFTAFFFDSHAAVLLNGALGRTRTCYPRLRRPMLYPDELRALKALLRAAFESEFKIGRGRGIRTPDPLVPNQMRYQAALCPEIFNSCFPKKKCMIGHSPKIVKLLSNL